MALTSWEPLKSVKLCGFAQDWTGDASKSSWGAPSRQSMSLNNELANHSLPDILKSRAENVDIEDIERGSLLGRG